MVRTLARSWSRVVCCRQLSTAGDGKTLDKAGDGPDIRRVSNVVLSVRDLTVAAAAVAVAIGGGAAAYASVSSPRQIHNPDNGIADQVQCSLPVAQRTGGWIC